MKRRLFSWLGLQAILGILLLFGIDYIFYLFLKVNPYFQHDKNSSLILTIELLIDIVLTFLVWQTIRYLQRIGKGMDGEIVVVRKLNHLPKDKFRVLSDFVDGEKGNTDFIVVGETGIWVIEVKNLKAGKITYRPNGLLYNGDFPINNNNGKNVMAQVHAEAIALQAHLLNVFQKIFSIQRIIVFSNPHSEMHFWDRPVDNVFIIRPPLLLELIQKSKPMVRTKSGGDSTVRPKFVIRGVLFHPTRLKG
jgi:hypothetical protein